VTWRLCAACCLDCLKHRTRQHRPVTGYHCGTYCLLCCCWPPPSPPQVVHTLTGHTNAVSCVSCSPLDEGLAVSAGEDRCLKVRGWMQRGELMTNMCCLGLQGHYLQRQNSE
jgi:WD40 repeat protein